MSSPTVIDWQAVIQALAQLLLPLGIAELERLEAVVTNPLELEAIKVALQILQSLETPPPIAGRRYMRGARPTPRHQLAAALPHRPTAREIAAAPPTFFTLPATMYMLGNSTYGDCVTAEQCAAIMAYSIWGQGHVQPKVTITDSTAIGWAQAHGVLNGAGLQEVMTWNQTDPIVGTNGTGYTDGTHLAVDYTNDGAVRAAIVQGPVKIGVAASQLQAALDASNGLSGWVLSGAGTDQNIDHCVSLWSYGTFADLVALFTAAGFACSVPSGQDPHEPSYGLYTWQTEGIISRSSMIAITGEGWLRTPTSPQITPTPTPTPAPTPTPVQAGYTGTLTVDTGLFGRVALAYQDGRLISVQ